MRSTHDVTGLLVAWGEGNRTAESELMEIVYAELKGLAKAYLRRESANQSLAANDLVHEAYLKLVDQRRVHWRNRSHFFRHRGAGYGPCRSRTGDPGGEARRR